MPFCQNCGNDIDETHSYCGRCGSYLKQSSGEPVGIPSKNSRKPYNKWVRVISIIYGFINLLGTQTRWQYFSESGVHSALIIEVLTVVLCLFLILLGLFPDIMNSKFKFLIDIESRFPEIIVGLIILSILLFGFTPNPPEGWWNYDPFNTYDPKTRFGGT
jgi:hypothetical protein